MINKYIVCMLYTTAFIVMFLYIFLVVYTNHKNVESAVSMIDLLGPKYPPTKGKIWPKPRHQISENSYYSFDPEQFNVTVIGKTCPTLVKAIERYSSIVMDVHGIARRFSTRHSSDEIQIPAERQDDNYKGSIRQLKVNLIRPCEDYPQFGMVESYNLTVGSVAHLSSTSIWGILRGLESWSQLLFTPADEGEIFVNKTIVEDAPKYPHRGLLIDTSRHYISLSKIIKTLDAMMMNKMNVLHWHIVDDQSFPFQSERFPNLSRLGAYHRSLVYTKYDIRIIVEYARERGIRVLPEFDIPGHTRSWGAAYPNILTECYSGEAVTGLGPLNPIKNVTYKFLQDLFVEIQELFPEQYFHIGGDEVDFGCWESNPEVKTYMRKHKLDSGEQLHALFVERVILLLSGRSKPIVWQEVFDHVHLSKDTLIQVWKTYGVRKMAKVLRAGYKLIFSSSWYLDHMHSGGDWTQFYAVDPRHAIAQYATTLDLNNVIGGEACMWGEMVDDMNILNRVWPRASAVAERLWSTNAVVPKSKLFNYIPVDVYHRLEEHVCRMNRRGIPAQPPNGPGFCLGAT